MHKLQICTHAEPTNYNPCPCFLFNVMLESKINVKMGDRVQQNLWQGQFQNYSLALIMMAIGKYPHHLRKGKTSGCDITRSHGYLFNNCISWIISVNDVASRATTVSKL